MRGITIDKISEGHAFSVILNFKIKCTDCLETIEEKEVVKAICIVTDSIDKTDDISLVEYECIGNRTDKDDFNENMTSLEDIKIIEGNNDNYDVKNEEFLKSNNLEEMISKINLEEIKNKTKSSYTFEDLLNTTLFTLEDIDIQSFDNYKFKYKLNGKINKVLPKQIIEGKLELKEIKNKTADCKFIVGDNKTANLECDINLEGYKALNQLTIRTTEIHGTKTIYLSQINLKLNQLEGCLKAKYNNINEIYECVSCKSGYIFINNDNNCKSSDKIGLSNNCVNATNLGTIENPEYSCIKSINNNTTIIIKKGGIIDYVPQINEFIGCLEAKEENEKIFFKK